MKVAPMCPLVRQSLSLIAVVYSKSIDQPTVIKNFHIFRSFLSCWILSVQTLDFSVFICYFPKTNIREPKVM